MLFVLAEHVSGQIERQADARLHARDAGLFAGRSILVIDEALERSMPVIPLLLYGGGSATHAHDAPRERAWVTARRRRILQS